MRTLLVALMAATSFVAISATAGDAPQTNADMGSGGGDELPAAWGFSPPDPGPQSALWDVHTLTATEQAYISRSTSQHDEEINSVYASSAAELSITATHESAAAQLGLDNLASEGVIP